MDHVQEVSPHSFLFSDPHYLFYFRNFSPETLESRDLGTPDPFSWVNPLNCTEVNTYSRTPTISRPPTGTKCRFGPAPSFVTDTVHTPDVDWASWPTDQFTVSNSKDSLLGTCTVVLQTSHGPSFPSSVSPKKVCDNFSVSPKRLCR